MMLHTHYEILGKITKKYNLNNCNALEELLIIEEQQHQKHMIDNNFTFGKSYFYESLGIMSARYKHE
jgi:hypothetical protein